MDDELGKDGNKDDDELTSRATSEIQLDAAEPKQSLKEEPKPGISRIHKHNTSTKNDADKSVDQCTVKEILNEILDCRVVRVSANQNSEESRDGCTNKSSQAVSEMLARSECQDADTGTSKVVTVKQILGEVLNYAVCRQPAQRQTVPAEFSEPGTSGTAPTYKECRSEVGERPRVDYNVFRTGIVNSSNALHDESLFGSRSSAKVLPSYSSVLRMGPRKLISTSSDCFARRLPPPSYADVEGLWDAASPSATSSDSAILGPDPLYVVCPVCRTVVVTDVQRERSNATHVLALLLCIFLCWPCCLLPYCMHSCSYSYHSCPNCRHYFGMYRPF